MALMLLAAIVVDQQPHDRMRVAARDLYTLNDQYIQDLFVVRSVSLAGYVILFYECLVTFPDEVRYIWPTRWSLVKIIYLLNRYGNVILLGLAEAQLMGIWWNPSPYFCFRSTLLFSFVQFVSFALIHVLVLLRAWATWGRQRRMLTILGSLFIVYASVSIAMLIYGVIEAGEGAYPLAAVTRSCIGLFPPYAWVLWIPRQVRYLCELRTSTYRCVISLVLECATFILTMTSIRQFNLHRNFFAQSTIVRVICRDGVAYFLVTLFSNTFNIVVWARASDRALNMLSTSFTLCLMIVAGQRLVLDLRKVTGEFDGLSTTRVGREVERAIDALPRSRSPSPIVFVDHTQETASTPIQMHFIELRSNALVDDDNGGKGGKEVVELAVLNELLLLSTR
ncbi:hypothetical protein BC628DRAFT_1415050 [Trametes gibbosa]|nr:hypothetical protein BC628DRAFT_1415050 [Trametes gibbosa]